MLLSYGRTEFGGRAAAIRAAAPVLAPKRPMGKFAVVEFDWSQSMAAVKRSANSGMSKRNWRMR